MADDKFFGEESQGEIISDSGLGNLPPLSDFDSQSGIGASDAGLPPLGGFDEVGRGGYDDGGLPPISDIDVETPQPSGISTPPPTPASGGMALETPVESRSGSFRDMGHDSDFSPETPEVGAGIPDSHLDTPMFDSAFGGGGVFEQNAAPAAPPQPTQAMDAPAFGGGAASGGGFGGGAFGAPQTGAAAGGGGGGFGGFGDSGFGMGAGFGGQQQQRPAGAGVATPAPDFSPDTAMKAVASDGGGGGGGVGMLALVAAIIVCLGLGLAGGIFGGPMLGFGGDKAAAQKAQQLQVENGQLKTKLAEAEATRDELKKGMTPEQLAALKTEYTQVQTDLAAAKAEKETIAGEVTSARAESDTVKEQMAKLKEDYLKQVAELEELKNETTIVQARQDGLNAEVERLTGLVGKLDEANVQRVATKEAFASSVDRLIVQIKEGMPITPAKYAYAERLAAAEVLREQLNGVNIIAPAQVQAYTDLLVKESQIARSTEYFFANLPLTDEFGNTTKKWCECLMKGNWAIYYRSLDNKNVGVYTNLGSMEAPVWGFKEDLPARVQKEVSDDVVANRVPDFAAKLQVLAQKEASESSETGFQAKYNSL